MYVVIIGCSGELIFLSYQRTFCLRNVRCHELSHLIIYILLKQMYVVIIGCSGELNFLSCQCTFVYAKYILS